MTVPLKPLPIVENWDCHGCGDCCHGAVVHLNDEDLRKLRRQRWDDDPEMQGKKYLVRCAWFGKGYNLGQQRDGRCIFQMDNKLCRIHAKFGYDAKPHICRMFPRQLVALDRFAYVTLRRCCPSAAADQGRTIAEQLMECRQLVESSQSEPKRTAPPALSRRNRRPWNDVFAAAESLNRLILDERYPLIRRVVHGLEFCNLLDRAALRKVDSSGLRELVSLLEVAAVEESGPWFQRRDPPQRLAGGLFRQAVLDYLRLHPAFVAESSWGERWRLIRASLAFSRGKGQVPRFRLPFPEATFDDLTRPLGPLPEDVLRPLMRYFTAAVVSLRYAMFKRRSWSLSDGFRALALGLPIALCVLRYACGTRPLACQDMVHVVMMLDRGETDQALIGLRHRLRVRSLTHYRQLAPLAVWYAR